MIWFEDKLKKIILAQRVWLLTDSAAICEITIVKELLLLITIIIIN